MYRIQITDVHGNTKTITHGEEARCDNCGKTSGEATNCIAGGYLCDEEWACCEECYDEMVKKGCCFEELGAGIYRQQKY